MGRDLWPAPFFTASVRLQQSSVSPPHTTACLGIQPHLHVPLPRRSHSLSDRGCHKPSYILPRVTKLRDASDKGSGPGRATRRITSLPVCSSLIFTPVGSQAVTPEAMRAVMIFFSLSPNIVCLCEPCCFRTLALLPPLSHLNPVNQPVQQHRPPALHSNGLTFFFFW